VKESLVCAAGRTSAALWRRQGVPLFGDHRNEVQLLLNIVDESGEEYWDPAARISSAVVGIGISRLLSAGWLLGSFYERG
jgi:hypothetical protein